MIVQQLQDRLVRTLRRAPELPRMYWDATTTAKDEFNRSMGWDRKLQRGPGGGLYCHCLRRPDKCRHLPWPDCPKTGDECK